MGLSGASLLLVNSAPRDVITTLYKQALCRVVCEHTLSQLCRVVYEHTLSQLCILMAHTYPRWCSCKGSTQTTYSKHIHPS